MAHHWPKEILIWHCNSSLMGQRVQLIMIILSLTALTFFQDVFPMAYILTIAELNWPTLQNMLKTLMHNYIYMCVCVWVCSVQSLNCRLCCTNWRVKIHRLRANLQTAMLIVQSADCANCWTTNPLSILHFSESSLHILYHWSPDEWMLFYVY